MGGQGKAKGEENTAFETSENISKETKVEVSADDARAEEYPFRFSWAMLWRFTGPGWLMSIAYLDPGNIEADLQSGVVTGYKLLWVLFWATVVGHIMQRLSARIGLVSGKHLAEVCQEHLHPLPNFLLWIMVELAVIGSDMQEVIGTALALYLLTYGALPIWAGALITIADTFTFLFLDRYGRRKLEFFFAFLILVMAVSFGINYGRDLPDQAEIALGTLIPRIPDHAALMTAVSTAGAVIMPHNFYLHSGLVANRKINRKSRSAVRDANFYTAVEGAIALAVSFIISLLVVSVFSHGMSEATFLETNTMCVSKGLTDIKHYPFNCSSLATDSCWTEQVGESASLFSAGIFLGCAFGTAYMYIWAVGILASGQASTMTGTYAGQFCMQGFLKLKWPQWKILIVTRLAAMFPTVLVAGFTNLDTVATLNEYLNALMFIMLPFAVIPCLTFSASRLVMNDFKNGLYSNILTCTLSVIMVLINFYFAYGTFNTWIGDASKFLWIPVVLFAIVYFLFIAYLTVYLCICLGWESLAHKPIIQKYYKVDAFLETVE
jgi:natural resistance-associated macrophage protein